MTTTREPSGGGEDHSTPFRELRPWAKVAVVLFLLIYVTAIGGLALAIGTGRV